MKTQVSLFLDTVLLAQITGMSDADEDLASHLFSMGNWEF